MDKMQAELKGEGHDVAFVAINSSDAVAQQGAMSGACSFPLFQDTEAVGAWQLHGGAKDDFIIYDAKGKVVTFLPFNGSVDTALSDSEGYANVKKAILAAM